MKEELKSCPFCGGKAHRDAYPLGPNWNTGARVYCDSCHAEIEIIGNINTVKEDQEKAVKLWNRRVTE